MSCSAQQRGACSVNTTNSTDELVFNHVMLLRRFLAESSVGSTGIKEAARTFQDVVGDNFAAFILADRNTETSTGRSVFLYDPWSLKEEVEEAVRVDHDNVFTEDSLRRLIKRNMKGAVGIEKARGSRSGTDNYPNLRRVEWSVAIEKHGPLVYELAMNAASPRWLTSDHSVKPRAKGLWDGFLSRTVDFEHRSLLRVVSWNDFHNKMCSVIQGDDSENVIDFIENTANRLKYKEQDIADWIENQGIPTKKELSLLFMFRPKGSSASTATDGLRHLQAEHEATLKALCGILQPTRLAAARDQSSLEDLLVENFLGASSDLFTSHYSTWEY